MNSMAPGRTQQRGRVGAQPGGPWNHLNSGLHSRQHPETLAARSFRVESQRSAYRGNTTPTHATGSRLRPQATCYRGSTAASASRQACGWFPRGLGPDRSPRPIRTSISRFRAEPACLFLYRERRDLLQLTGSSGQPCPPHPQRTLDYTASCHVAGGHAPATRHQGVEVRDGGRQQTGWGGGWHAPSASSPAVLTTLQSRLPSPFFFK